MMASTFGYFDWFLKSDFMISLKSKLRETQFQMVFLRNLWWLENAPTIEEMRKRLVSILVKLNFDHARLTIFSPPIDERGHQREVIYSAPKPGSKMPLVSAPLQLNIPLISGKTVHGYLFVEKHIMETALPQKWLLNLVERTAKSVLDWIVKNRNKWSHPTFVNNDLQGGVRKQTFILIAKSPAMSLNQPH